MLGLHVDYDYRRPTIGARRVSERAAHEFAAKCAELTKKDLRVCAVGHSFGTLVIGRAVDLVPELKLHRVVLSSSILRRGFGWRRLHSQKRVKKVMNEYCPGDWVAPLSVLYRLLCLPTGRSGTKGFSDACDGAVANVTRAGTTHPSPQTSHRR